MTLSNFKVANLNLNQILSLLKKGPNPIKNPHLGVACLLVEHLPTISLNLPKEDPLKFLKNEYNAFNTLLNTFPPGECNNVLTRNCLTPSVFLARVRSLPGHPVLPPNDLLIYTEKEIQKEWKLKQKLKASIDKEVGKMILQFFPEKDISTGLLQLICEMGITSEMVQKTCDASGESARDVIQVFVRLLLFWQKGDKYVHFRLTILGASLKRIAKLLKLYEKKLQRKSKLEPRKWAAIVWMLQLYAPHKAVKSFENLVAIEMQSPKLLFSDIVLMAVHDMTSDVPHYYHRLHPIKENTQSWTNEFLLLNTEKEQNRYLITIFYRILEMRRVNIKPQDKAQIKNLIPKARKMGFLGKDLFLHVRRKALVYGLELPKPIVGF